MLRRPQTSIPPALHLGGTAAAESPKTLSAGGPAPLMCELRAPIAAGVLVIALGLGGFGIWAAAAPLAGAAIAPGVISPDGSRRTVQHLEGGIIDKILVEDGTVVQTGQPMLVLEDIQARATHDVLQSRLYSLAAIHARLVAEQARSDEIDFPRWLIEAAGNDTTALEAIVMQRELFRTRAQELADRRGILSQQIAQLREEITGLDAQIEADAQRIALITEEIQGLDFLYRKGLAPKTKLLALHWQSRTSVASPRTVPTRSTPAEQITRTHRRLRHKYLLNSLEALMVCMNQP
jgi:membrane fusion protein, type I secretion system